MLYVCTRAGGLCLGYGIESSSHRVGLFFEACVLEAEVVLGDGKVVVVTPTNEHKELYASLPFSCKFDFIYIWLCCCYCLVH